MLIRKLPKKMLAVVQTGDGGEVLTKNVPVPDIKENEALIKVMSTGICGSDLYRNMRKYPGIPGHEISGEIIDIKGDNSNFNIGNRVVVAPLVPCFKCIDCQKGYYTHCKNYTFIGSSRPGGLAQYVIVPLTNLIKISNKLSYDKAALVEPSSVALHAIRMAGVGVGDFVAVFGAGPIGLLIAMWAGFAGAQKVSISDITDKRLEVAKSLGIDDVFDAKKGNYVEHLMGLVNGEGIDISFETAGNITTQRQAIESTKYLGKVILLGITHNEFSLPEKLGESILRKEMMIMGSWAAYSSPFPGKDWFDSIELITQNKFRVEELVDSFARLEEGNKIYGYLKKSTKYIKILFHPNN
jgi:L-iditol 2-dehydrogenase